MRKEPGGQWIGSSMNNSVAVIGAGAWGTALALVVARTGQRVTLWARDPARAERIAATRRNPRLPGIELPPEITVTSTLPEAEIALLAVPLQHLRAVLALLPPCPILVDCAKGVESHSLRLPLEIIAEVAPHSARAVLSGPNFAGEIAHGLPAASVVAAEHAAVRAAVMQALSTPEFRLYGNDDPIGAQLGGAAKNVIAIAAGAAIGAGLGENARAALITRGLAEITRMVVASGGRAATATGLSGLGDLLLTCTGAGSRNFRLGFALGQGSSVAEALAASVGVAEGAATAPALLARASALGVSLPICHSVAHVVTGQASVAHEIAALLARPTRDE
jgi:glycerol-3-phosphate dehydrogenase (NAD(P)+)